MKIFRVGILSLLAATVINSTGCSILNQVRAQNELVDGAKAYKERKFDEAERRFTRALDLEQNSKTAQLFLARTLHQQYLAKRDSQDNIKKAERAVSIYQTILSANPNDEPTNDAIASLIGPLKGPVALDEWRLQRANDANVNGESRAKAFTLLAGEQYRCVDEITELNKETVEKGNEAIYVFKKPENEADFSKAKQCADAGMGYIDKALALDSTRSSPWSYKASLMLQKSRLAEMDGNTADKDKFLAESEAPKAKFRELSEKEAVEREAEEKRKAEEEKAKE